MESGKLKTLSRIGKVFYFVGFAAIVVSALGLLYFLVIMGGKRSVDTCCSTCPSILWGADCGRRLDFSVASAGVRDLDEYSE